MKFLIGAFGTRGDVQPGLALAQALGARRHSVTLAVPPDSLSLARAQGIEAQGVGLDYESISPRAAHGSLREMLGLLPLVRAQVGEQLAALEPAARGADVIVGVSVFMAGSLLAEASGRPFAFFGLGPQLFESADYPSFAVPFQRLPRGMNRASWAAHHVLWNRLLRTPLNRLREERGLAPVRRVWPALIGGNPFLAADPALAPAPRDHPIELTQVGALWLDDSQPLSEPTRAFLDAGPAPVYVGFGSMPDPDPARSTRRLLEAVRRAGARAVVSRGWARLGGEADPAGVLFVGPEPHGRLFPRCAALVHHGGAGTTHAAARAGVPQVVMPQLLDQHFWAHRVQVAGIGPGRVRRHGDDPEPLARALRRCLEDRGLCERAREVSRRMINDGPARAAERLERLTA